MKVTMEELVNYAKQYGFIFQGSEIYNGLANAWDYGPLGTNLKENIRNVWKKKFIQENPYNYGLDSAIIMNPNVWVASGHVASFADPLIDCKKCKARHRADKLVEDFTKGKETGDGWSNEKLEKYIADNKIECPQCGGLEFTPIRKFNLLFETQMGVTEDTKNTVYLRGETAQGIFVNFKNIERSMRLKIPFGVCQTGKAFRNEITPGNFIFRLREFEQMELEFFCKPGTDLEWFKYWKDYCIDFLNTLGIKKENLRFRDHDPKELAFYSKATTDIEFQFPFGWGELWGIADRTDYDLNTHMEHSGADLRVIDPDTNEKYLPFCIEPSVGLDRLLLALLVNAYSKEKIDDEERIILKIHPALAPIKATVLPLIKKVHGEKANEVYTELSKYFFCSIDEAGSIGKRYRRSDAIGTPYCITIDDESLNNDLVTIRNRDTMEQEQVKISDIKSYIEDKIRI
jgi:glycyl-tRNA synthetase